jgi:hypothetical protein
MNKATKKSRVSIVVFIDALGWEVLKNRPFMERELPYRRKLRSVLGFSSACVPSILTGALPQDHNHWSFFFHAPERSPFKALRWMRFFPKWLAERGRVRNLISKLVKQLYKYDGYFQLYNMPFEHLHLFDYCEKRDLFKPGGINRGTSIFDDLHEAGVEYHVSDWRDSERANLEGLKHELERARISFAFLYLAEMDGLLHRTGKASTEIDDKLKWYEAALRDVLVTATRFYDDVHLHVCSDHGMATVHTTVDIMSRVERLGLAHGVDYVATYDSTMARFWFRSQSARAAVRSLLEPLTEGRILEESELDDLGCRFEEDRFGQLIFLTNPGVLIVPSHMGRKPIVGMHGYHPDDPDSDASLLSSVPPPGDPKCITDIYGLMRAEARI